MQYRGLGSERTELGLNNIFKSICITWTRGWENGVEAKGNWKWNTVQMLGAKMGAEECVV